MKIVGRTKNCWLVELTDGEILDVAKMEPPDSFQIGGEYEVSEYVKLARWIKLDQVDIQSKLESMIRIAKELW